MLHSNFYNKNISYCFGNKYYDEFYQTPHNFIVKRLEQIHSDKIFVVDDVNKDTRAIEADALVTQIPGVMLSIMTADCVPLLLYKNKTVATIHAGWRGAIAGVIENTLNIIKSLENGNLKDIVGLIGPCIRQPSYEVSEEIFTLFRKKDSLNEKYLKNVKKGKYMFDLPGYCKKILNEYGVKIYDTEVDTCKNTDTLFSYRYSFLQNNLLDKNDRQISTIGINK